MELLYKPDFDESLQRYEAFWHREIIDRPPVRISMRKPGAPAIPRKEYATYEEQWLDIDGRIAAMDADMAATDFLYDSLPIAWPNLGPEIFSAWCGCGYEYGKDTTWSTPVIHDWETDFDKSRLDMNHPLFQKMIEFTQKLIAAGRGKFIVGMTDFHPGGDHLAALRDPENLAFDMLEEPEYVKKTLERSQPEFFAAYGVFYNMLREAGMPITSWLPLIHNGRYYIPSCDFSCMISTEMFEEYFLPGLAQECKFYDRSIYHLDGPGALRHLDSLLSIPDLDAIQWQPTVGDYAFDKWRSVYQRIQKANKGVWLLCDVRELGDVFDSLRPEGVCFASISGIDSRETADKVVKCIERWSL